MVKDTVIYVLKIPCINILVIYEFGLYVRASKSYIGKISSYTYVLKIVGNQMRKITQRKIESSSI